MHLDNKQHWETIYSTKTAEEVSWTQVRPTLSLYFIEQLAISKDAAIIDIGGGDSHLVDFLLDADYTNISVLDISEAAIARAKTRLGKRAEQVKWIVSDVLDFNPTSTYAVWHDRATFHFLRETVAQENYLKKVAKFAESLIVATFSTDGPLKCSGLEICQYDEESMKRMFESAGFVNTTCKREDHVTPFATTQNFVFCGFKRKTD